MRSMNELLLSEGRGAADPSTVGLQSGQVQWDIPAPHSSSEHMGFVDCTALTPRVPLRQVRAVWREIFISVFCPHHRIAALVL